MAQHHNNTENPAKCDSLETALQIIENLAVDSKNSCKSKKIEAENLILCPQLHILILSTFKLEIELFQRL